MQRRLLVLAEVHLVFQAGTRAGGQDPADLHAELPEAERHGDAIESADDSRGKPRVRLEVRASKLSEA